ncbi:MAG TPA: transposase [Candidatus Gemmiger faecigallinarum]|nr:transposase [Candidatus Gemmiger faecigallinarum]
MYRAQDSQLSVYDFLPPYHGELAADNRWVRLAAVIDWEGFEKEYSALFARGGKVAIPARVALGSLVVREVYGATDRQTVELIRESPYLQYFIGLKTFGDTLPFSYRSMERFRARIPRGVVRRAVRAMRELEKKDKK